MLVCLLYVNGLIVFLYSLIEAYAQRTYLICERICLCTCLGNYVFWGKLAADVFGCNVITRKLFVGSYACNRGIYRVYTVLIFYNDIYIGLIFVYMYVII